MLSLSCMARSRLARCVRVTSAITRLASSVELVDPTPLGLAKPACPGLPHCGYPCRPLSGISGFTLPSSIAATPLGHPSCDQMGPPRPHPSNKLSPLTTVRNSVLARHGRISITHWLPRMPAPASLSGFLVSWSTIPLYEVELLQVRSENGTRSPRWAL
ncbi:hypothetical protein BHE90_012351 [Fusarium euwallaceae]|uniref:Uncharacterized protein n=3 Tax=Fusarium solani species complex TaxID=232080 RepID=A0A430LC22_9HYPO|nr:hypothetical protein CEP51_009549 [Fusarium floridanum]RSL97286.1 hypothetical protein CDV31_013096 [Fusarium ambrosium]RTE73220.1 hypothetical protein BHE90_012351 [Fusarium euwallaceae]